MHIKQQIYQTMDEQVNGHVYSDFQTDIMQTATDEAKK